MRGPNLWSSEHTNLIVLKINTEDLTEQHINAFFERSAESIPALACLPVKKDVADLMLCLANAAAELQRMAGMDCDYKHVVPGKNKDEYNIVFSYTIERAGIYAGECVFKFAEACIIGQPFNIDIEVAKLIKIRINNSLGPTTSYILDEVKRRHIPFRQFDGGSLMVLGYGIKQKKIRTAVTDTTSGLGIELAGDKEETKKMLAQANLPVPKGILVYSAEELKERLHEVSFPVVTKPLDGNHGRGVTTDIRDLEKALFGYSVASKISDGVIVEQFITGDDYRFLVIDYKLVAVARRTPATITGDGIKTIKEIIELENKNPQRGDGAEHVLALIKLDAVTLKLLSEKGLTQDSVIAKGEKLVVKDTANISAGGTAEDVTDDVNPETKFLAERVARLFNLDICGIDIMMPDIREPLTAETGSIIEVNAGPGLRMHSNPQTGKPRNVAAAIIDMMFPEPSSHQIPLIAVTGTNGKTTTTRLIAHLAKQAGFKPGYTTTEGIYIDGHLTYKGDCTGFISAQDVLFEPVIDFAVLECARGGIIRSGLAFNQCDVSIVTNITPDHLGLKDIHTIEDMAAVKLVVPKTTKKDGYAILNADDDLVFGMQEKLDCNIALFSLDENNTRIKQHTANGGLSTVIANGYLVINKGGSATQVLKIDAIPLTLNGRSESMIKNILPATLAAYIQNISLENIREGLSSFLPSPAQTPGRMNIFKFKNFELMLDYAHNLDGFEELKKFMHKTSAVKKVGIISVSGDRRDDDIRTMGTLCADMFDEIIIRHDKDMRGRTHESLNALLIEGIGNRVPVKIISNEQESIRYAVDHAESGSFIAVCTDEVLSSIDYITELLNEEKTTGTILTKPI